MNNQNVSEYPIEFNTVEIGLIEYVVKNGLTRVSKERLFATLTACKYVCENNIDGDFVECGVWRGGNAIVAAGIFKIYNSDKKVYCFDTFEGMTEPTDIDFNWVLGKSAKEWMEESPSRKESGYSIEGCYASLNDVKNNFQNANLLSDNIVFIKGDVLKTLDNNENIPEKIAVLRLDTDWYESTKKEMDVLYPCLTGGGILMIDDYGHWGGSKKAVDEYFENVASKPFFHYIDHTGRLILKI